MRQPDSNKHTEGRGDEGENQDSAERNRNSANGCISKRQVSVLLYVRRGSGGGGAR